MINIYHKNNTLFGWVDMEKSVTDPFADAQGVSMFTKDVSLADDETLANFDFVNETADVVKAPPPIDTSAKDKALDYLSSTDWYVVRFAEVGTPVPAEVTTKRAEARATASNN